MKRISGYQCKVQFHMNQRGGIYYCW